MNSRYNSINTLTGSYVEGKENVRFKQTTFYPLTTADVNDEYVITTYGDRYDILAQQYYGRSDLWWIIAAANDLEKDSLYPPEGIQLRIPYNKDEFLIQYKSINQLR